jgi:3-methyl-2-oxobutanoate hydroxymethyltransferase
MPERPSAARALRTRITAPELREMKQAGEPIVMLTAYDFPFARLVDAAGVDVVLVGDTLGAVVQGFETTLPVTLDQMVYHTRMVTSACRRALVASDLPFGSYQQGPEQAVESAIRLVKEGGAQAVKLEGGGAIADAIGSIVAAGLPVFSHLGLTPQAYHRMGGHRVQGRDAAGRERLLADARAIERAGASAVVLEGIPLDLAREITDALGIPTIGIGAGPYCDGQVLVLHDLLGLTQRPPRFAKAYASLASEVARAAAAYVSEVKAGAFPTEAHAYRQQGEPS